ncbi:hypothetical protein [Nocardiopsis coralliicola]
MNDFLLVLTGGGIALVSSVAVTWLHARHVHRGEVRTATRESTRQLTGLFIAEREAAVDGRSPTASVAEAEMMAVAVTDRKTRERVRALIRLLRELHLPELQELGGQTGESGRRIICDHALEVLGAHFRGERLPAVPEPVQRMLDVEDEALNIHTGGAPAAPAPSPAGKGSVPAGKAGAAKAAGKAAPKNTGAPGAGSASGSTKEAKKEPTRKPGRRPRSAGADDSADTARRTGAVAKDPEESSFWNE